MIIITGSIRMKPEHRTEAIRLGIEHSTRSRAEPGCLAHNVHVDAEDATRLVIVEEWADMAAVQAHFAVPESGGFVKEVSAIATGRPEMRIYAAKEVPAADSQ